MSERDIRREINRRIKSRARKREKNEEKLKCKISDRGEKKNMARFYNMEAIFTKLAGQKQKVEQ